MTRFKARLTVLTFLILTGSLFAKDPVYQLVRIPIHSDKEAVPLLRLGLDVVDAVKGEYLEAVCHPADVAEIQALGYYCDVLIDDMESFYADLLGPSDDMGGFRTYDETVDLLFETHADHPNITTEPFSIGQTIEGREMWAIKISDNPDVDENEVEVLFTSLHHAREPAGLELNLELIRKLTDEYDSTTVITDLVNTREIFFVPIVNPDGYVYNEETNPSGGGMWRKNRRDNGGGVFGVDINRNYGYCWGLDDEGSSPYPEDETYRGTAPFSEPETENIRQFCLSRHFALAQNVHTYGNKVLYPWGSSVNGYTPEQADFEAMAQTMVNQWLDFCTYGTCFELLYEMNGDADDWMYGEQQDKSRTMALTYEVGPTFWFPYYIMEVILETFVPPSLYQMQMAGEFFTPEVSLIPADPPIVIPGSGGSFDFSINLSNGGPEAITTDTWCDVVLPNGEIYGPITGPVEVTLPTGASLSRDRVQNIPGGAPEGTYIYRWWVGDYPDITWHVSSFEFEKLPAGDDSGIGNWNNYGEPLEVQEMVMDEAAAPKQIALVGCYPNPFNPTTNISYQLSSADHVSLSVYDINGRLIELVDAGYRDAGSHLVEFDASGLPSGIMIYQLQTSTSTITGKMLLLK